MLRLLTKRLPTLPANIMHCVGMALERNLLSAAQVETTNEGLVLHRTWCLPLPQISDSTAPLEAWSELTRGIAKVLAETDQPYFAVQLALPDPLVQVKVFELETVPESEYAQQQFARWRLAKDYHREIDQLEIRTQKIERAGLPSLLLVEAIDQAFLEKVLACTREAGVLLSTTDMASRFRLAGLRNQFIHNQPAALVSVEQSYWSLMIWDSDGNLRLVQSRWFESSGSSKDDAQKIAREIDQRVRLFCNEPAHQVVKAVYVQGDSDISAALVVCLPELTGLPCSPVALANCSTAPDVASANLPFTALVAGVLE